MKLFLPSAPPLFLKFTFSPLLVLSTSETCQIPLIILERIRIRKEDRKSLADEKKITSHPCMHGGKWSTEELSAMLVNRRFD